MLASARAPQVFPRKAIATGRPIFHLICQTLTRLEPADLSVDETFRPLLDKQDYALVRVSVPVAPKIERARRDLFPFCDRVIACTRDRFLFAANSA
jgi:hypothetical protein